MFMHVFGSFSITKQLTSENSYLLSTMNSRKTESGVIDKNTLNDNCKTDELSTCEHLDLNGKIHECFYRRKKRTLRQNVYA